MNKTTPLFSIGQPKGSAYIGQASPGVPLQITALQIPPGCQIQFDRIEYSDGLTKEVFACGVGDMYSGELGTLRYRICDCEPFLDSQVQRLYIDEPGHYLAVIVPEDGCLGQIEAYVREAPEMAGQLDDRLRGCCGKPQANLSVKKTADKSTYSIGETVTYTVTAFNSGPSNANLAVLKDKLPSTLSGITVTLAYAGGAAGLASITAAELTAGYKIPVFPPNSSVVATITGTATQTGVLVNHVSIAAPEGVEDPDTSDNEDEVIVNVIENYVDLSIAKTVTPANPLVGESVTYTAPFANAGPKDANGATITDVLPANFVPTGMSVSYSGGASGPATVVPTLPATSFTVTTLPPGGGGVVTVTGHFTKAGSYTNKIGIKAPLGRVDVDPSNNNDAVGISINLPEADLWVTKAVSDATPAAGEAGSFTIAVGNNGPQAADGAVFADVLPAGLQYGTISIVYSNGGAGPATVNQGELAAGITLSAAPPNGLLATVVVNYLVPAGAEGTVLQNNVKVRPPAGVLDADQSNNTATVIITVQTPALHKCDGSVLTPADGVLTVGALLKCDGSPVTCGTAVLTCQEELGRFSDLSQNVGAGICVFIDPIAYDANERLVYQARDNGIIAGVAQLPPGTNPPAHLAVTVTNPYSGPAVLEAELRSKNNVNGLDSSLTFDRTVTFMHKLSDDLNIAPVFNFYGDDPSVNIINVEQDGYNNTNTIQHQFYEQTSGTAKVRYQLAPGESKTLYGQWWAIFWADQGIAGYTLLHGHMSLAWKLHRNTVLV